MNDFRRAPRRDATGIIPVVDVMTGETVGQLGNLSETGCLLVLRRQLVSDALYQFRFSLEWAPGETAEVEVGAHELWRTQAAAPGQVWTGVRFIDISPENREHLRRWASEDIARRP